MNPNEFRVGNWVLDLRDNWVQIKGVNYLGFLIKNKENLDQVPFSSFKPIELNSEVLWIWGFSKMDQYTFVKNGFFIHSRKRGLVIRKNILIIKYFHQLQNAYFTFKGKELWMIKE
jgi:hypothetical protein